MMGGPRAGDCDFPVDPLLDARQAQVWWRPELDARLILLVASGGEPDPRLLPPASARKAEAAIWWTLGSGRQVRRVMLEANGGGPQGLSAVLPMDSTLPVRLQALGDLWRDLAGRPPRSIDPVTPQRRRRMKAMLRAGDGRSAGAAYREIASVLFGMARVAAEPWKTSSLRDATLRLVRDERAMVAGGYQALLS